MNYIWLCAQYNFSQLFWHFVLCAFETSLFSFAPYLVFFGFVEVGTSCLLYLFLVFVLNYVSTSKVKSDAVCFILYKLIFVVLSHQCPIVWKGWALKTCLFPATYTSRLLLYLNIITFYLWGLLHIWCGHFSMTKDKP